MPLDTELATFERLKAELLVNHIGKFALIKGEEFVGAFDTADNAYAEGVRLYGREPFLVRRIAQQDEVYRNQAFTLGLMNARI